MERGLFVKIKSYENYASSAEKELIRQLNENPKKFVGKNLKELSEMTYTSQATIYRLCRKIGFKGYKEFQQALIFENAIMQESARTSMKDIEPGLSTDEIINQVSMKNMDSLEKSMKLVKSEDIEKCVSLIENARCINMFGVGSSLLVARDFYLKLIRIGKLCNICDDLHAQLLCSKTIEKNDIAIVISYSGLTPEMIECAKTAKERGAKVIAITRSYGSKLAKYADVVLGVAATELIIRSGAMSSRIAQLNMVDILYVAYVDRHYEELHDTFAKTQIQKMKGGEG